MDPTDCREGCFKEEQRLAEGVEPGPCEGLRAQRLAISQDFSRRRLTLAFWTDSSCAGCRSLGISVCKLTFAPSHQLQLPSWASVMRTNVFMKGLL